MYDDRTEKDVMADVDAKLEMVILTLTQIRHEQLAIRFYEGMTRDLHPRGEFRGDIFDLAAERADEAIQRLNTYADAQDDESEDLVRI